MGTSANWGKLVSFTAASRKRNLIPFGYFSPGDNIGFIANVPTDLYYAQSYGARIDGTTDDTAALRAAIAAATVTSGTVMIAAGTCMISGKLSIPSGVTLSGSGMNVTTIKITTGGISTGATFAASSGYAALIIASSSYARICDLTLDTGTNSTIVIQAFNGIFVDASSHCQLSNVRVNYTFHASTTGTVLGSAIVVSSQSDYNRLVNCTVNGPGTAAAGYLCGGIFINGNRNFISACSVSGTTDNGFTANNFSGSGFTTLYNTFDACDFTGNAYTTYGFHAENASWTTFSDCVATGVIPGAGFRVSPYSPLGLNGECTSIINPRVNGTGAGDGIYIKSATPGDTPATTRVSVEGGFIEGMTIGVHIVNDAGDITVQGIQITSPASHGVEVDSTAALKPKRIVLDGVKVKNPGAPAQLSYGMLFYDSDNATGSSPGKDVTITDCQAIDTRAGALRGMDTGLAIISAKGAFTPTVTNWVATNNNFTNAISAGTNLSGITQTNCYIPAGGNLA